MAFHMRIGYLLSSIVFFAAPCLAQSYHFLPPNVKAADMFGVGSVTSKSGIIYTEKVTVKDKLDTMHARCTKGKLVDGRGRQVRFYFVQGCWGNPPANYLEIQDREKKEIARLKEKYTVIEMTCNRNGGPPRQ